MFDILRFEATLTNQTTMHVLFRWVLVIAVVLLAEGLAAVPAAAQTPKKQAAEKVSRYALPQVYREARLQKMLVQILAELPPVRPRAPEPMPNAYDTLAQWLAQFDPDYIPPPPPIEPLVVKTWKLYKRVERNGFQRRFEGTEWAYLGNNQYTEHDTSRTALVRARMQEHFGAPTKTLVELDYSRNLRAEEYIQFEYWFAVNDSIPLIVMDVHGPFDRGVVVLSDQKYRDDLFSLRQQLLAELPEASPAPYVDYYFNPRTRRWYRTGFDGHHFFTDPIGQPNLARGRPQLGTPNR